MESRDFSASEESIAYKVMRTVWVPWQRERRLVREEERIQATRRSACLDAGSDHAAVLRRDGGVACWGFNDYGEAPVRCCSSPNTRHCRCVATRANASHRQKSRRSLHQHPREVPGHRR